MMSSIKRSAVKKLSPEHHEMVMKYLRFAILQRNQQLKDLQIAIGDYKDNRLGGDDTFTADEVGDMLDSLGEILRADMFRDLQRASHSNVVLVQQIMGQAEDCHVQISVDISALEDEALLEDVAKLEKDSEKPPPAALNLEPTALKQMVLPSLDSHKETELLGNARLKMRLSELQQELTRVNREKTEIRERLEKAEGKIATLCTFATTRAVAPEAGQQLQQILGEEFKGLAIKTPAGDENEAPPFSNKDGTKPEIEPSGKVHETVTELQERLRERSAAAEQAAKAVEASEKALQSRLDQAPQFKILKGEVTKKNAQIRFLREQLAGFGWTNPEEG